MEPHLPTNGAEGLPTNGAEVTRVSTPLREAIRENEVALQRLLTATIEYPTREREERSR